MLFGFVHAGHRTTRPGRFGSTRHDRATIRGELRIDSGDPRAENAHGRRSHRGDRDRPGVDRAVAELESMLDLKHVEGERRTPVVKTVARKGEGVSKLIQEIDKHMNYLKEQDLLELRRRKRYEAELVEIIRREL